MLKVCRGGILEGDAAAGGDNAMPGLEAPVWFRRFPILHRRLPPPGWAGLRQAGPTGAERSTKDGGRYRDEGEGTKYKL